MSEAGGPTGYASGDWSCVGGTFAGTTVTVALGENVTCTINNNDEQAHLTLVKQVENGDSGATAPATDWTLGADGPTPISGATGATDVTSAPVDAGTYDLSESGPTGYTASAWDCGDATLAGTTLTVPNGGNITCTIVNTAIAPTLTLVKVVDNGNTGATNAADAWALTADGPTLVTVSTGTTTPAQVGTYDLSESGPNGYDASGWVCTGASGSSTTSVTLALDENATCTITNTAQQPHLTLVKTVTNNNGGTALPTAWTLSADGPTTGVSGPVDDPTVTDVPVAIGKYALAEAGGPSGYTPGNWSCDGGTFAGSTVTLALGDDVTCTINNDDVLGTWDLAKSSNPVSGSTVLPDALITYTVTATKTGGVNPVDRVVKDDLSGVLNHATLVGSVTASTGTASITGTTLTWNIPSLGGTETVTYTVRVDADAYGVRVGNLVTGEGSDTCPPANPGGECKTTHVTPHYTLTKVSDPTSGSTVLPGDTISYTLTVHNDSQAVLNGAIVTDNLSDVLDNATIGTIGAGGALSGTTLTWTVPTVQPGDTTTLTYEVTVNDGAYGETIGNVATPGPGGDCEESADCTTTHPTPHYTLTKVSDPTSGSTVLPGDTISYTLTVHNDSQAVLNGAIVTDNLSDVLDNATIGTIGAGGALSGTTLTWTVPTVQPGDTTTLTYKVTVNDGAYGETIGNVATPGPGGDCEESADCTTTHPTPHYTLTKVSDPASGSTVLPGDTISYTLTVHNDSQAVLNGAIVTDNLSDVLDNATIGTIGAGGALNGTTLTWTVPTVQPGDTTTLTYEVTVNDGAYGETIGNVATPGPGGDCEESADCTTTHPTPHWTLTKTSDPASGADVQPGSTIAYTLTVHNDSLGVVNSATVTDDLSDVLDDATIGTIGAGGVLNGTTLTWTVPTPLQPGDTATLTYQVTVNPDAFNATIGNVATPGPGGECEEANDCTTTHETPGWVLSKTSDPVSGSTVEPGSSITYTLEATNTSQAVVTGAVATDDLSDVLDNATLDAVPSGATLSGTTLTWAIPTLMPGASEQLSYTVTVNDDATNQTLHNVVTPGTGGNCVPIEPQSFPAQRAAAIVSAAADDPPACETTHFTPAWTLAKTSDPTSGSTVQPGSTISYTLTATNVADDATLTGATATDDLSQVLDHGSLVSVPTGATLSGTTLTWQIPDLAPGASATLTYQVKLDSDAWDVTLTNVATPHGGQCVESCTTEHKTPPKPHEPNLPNTGGPTLAVVGVGLALLLGGGGLMLWSRRRKAD